MRLNAFEKLLMNNPVRAAIQRRFEGPRLKKMGGSLAGAHVLEVGCGRGVGVEIALRQFGAERVDAFDLDPEMIELARRRLEPWGDRVRLWVGDVARIASPDATYDAVLDFGTIHHVPRWRDAVAEIHRVLKPGGRLFAEEVLAPFIHHPVWRRLLDHPMEDRFHTQDFADALRRTGFEIVALRERRRRFAWFVARRA
jgi:ubiquinone/menaquinone biosynthesis C-methylase UbiE